ncbi:Cytochrome c oxidase subunit 4 [Arachnomyces sp. PD_36]|nr:Cytochrome c oxidase subunit 4 [Arachnomyces sp. PD_36]
MFVQRTAFALARRTPVRAIAKRSFTSSIARFESKPDDASKPRTKWDPKPGEKEPQILSFDEIKSEDDLRAPGAAPGTMPTDIEQATGLERFELLGKMQGIDVFDMKPLDASRLDATEGNAVKTRLNLGDIAIGTLDDPIIVKSAGDEQYVGCTGFPADSHETKWLTVSRARPLERCSECGNCVKMAYVGPPDDPHDHHHHHGAEEPKTFVDYVKPEYWYR